MLGTCGVDPLKSCLSDAPGSATRHQTMQYECQHLDQCLTPLTCSSKEIMSSCLPLSFCIPCLYGKTLWSVVNGEQHNGMVVSSLLLILEWIHCMAKQLFMCLHSTRCKAGAAGVPGGGCMFSFCWGYKGTCSFPLQTEWGGFIGGDTVDT